MSKTATVYRMVTDQHICPYGIRTVFLLKRKGFDVDDHHLASREETDAFKQKHGVKTTPQTFIDGERIGGYDDLRDHFGFDPHSKDGTSYQPVIALFATTALMALAGSWATPGDLFSLRTIEWFVAFSMCLLAVLKLRDLYAFSNQFLGYDLLAQRFLPYAYFYPFAELFAGVGMIAMVLTPLVASVAVFIGAVGGISVFKAVYIDKRELKCACVGGNSNVPLGFVSLTENLMMLGMGLWMLARYYG